MLKLNELDIIESKAALQLILDGKVINQWFESQLAADWHNGTEAGEWTYALWEILGAKLRLFLQMKQIYLEFLRYCLDDRSPLPESARHIDWMQMLEWAERQAVVGIIYGGITDGRCLMEDVSNTLEYLGLTEIAGAVMWVLKEVLGLEEQYLIAPVDERRGRFLLDEIMQGGNFGRGMMADGGWKSTAIGRNMYRLKRDVRLLRYFPSECLWEPVFRVYHFFWRIAHR